MEKEPDANRNPISYLFCALLGMASNTIVTSLVVSILWDPGLSFGRDELIWICGVIPGLAFGLLSGVIGNKRGWRYVILFSMAFASGIIWPSLIILTGLIFRLLGL